MIRITGGKFNGHTIKTPPVRITRPTSSKVRQAVMNMLVEYLQGAVFLDLFAGSGIMGMEALSRGAKGCVFVDNSKVVFKFLKQNLINLRHHEAFCAESLNPCLTFMQDCANLQIPKSLAVDIVWADPPYSQCAIWHPKLLKCCTEISHPVIFALEVPKLRQRDYLESDLQGWNLWKHKVYGDTEIMIYKR